MSGNMCISHVYGVRPFFAMPLCEGAAVCIESYASHKSLQVYLRIYVVLSYIMYMVMFEPHRDRTKMVMK